MMLTSAAKRRQPAPLGEGRGGPAAVLRQPPPKSNPTQPNPTFIQAGTLMLLALLPLCGHVHPTAPWRVPPLPAPHPPPPARQPARTHVPMSRWHQQVPPRSELLPSSISIPPSTILALPPAPPHPRTCGSSHAPCHPRSAHPAAPRSRACTCAHTRAHAHRGKHAHAYKPAPAPACVLAPPDQVDRRWEIPDGLFCGRLNRHPRHPRARKGEAIVVVFCLCVGGGPCLWCPVCAA